MASYHNAKPTTGWKAVIEFFKPLVWWIEPVLLMIRIIPEFFEFPENVPLLMCAEGFLLLTFIAFLIAGVLTFVGNVFLLVGKVTVWLFGLPFEAGRYANETMGRSHSWLD